MFLQSDLSILIMAIYSTYHQRYIKHQILCCMDLLVNKNLIDKCFMTVNSCNSIHVFMLCLMLWHGINLLNFLFNILAHLTKKVCHPCSRGFCLKRCVKKIISCNSNQTLIHLLTLISSKISKLHLLALG